MQIKRIIYVGLVGFIGASLRYLISYYSPKLLGTQLPYGTLGGVLMGLIMKLSMNSELISPDLKLFLTTGILGGFTKFSTFSYETISLFSSGSYFLCTVNTCLNLFLSLGGVLLGNLFASNII